MPHVRRSMLIWVDADCEHVQRALTDTLALTPTDDSDDAVFDGPIVGMPDTGAQLLATIVETTPDTTRVRLETSSTVRVPFFTWFLRLQAWLGARRALPHAAARLTAAATGADPPSPLRSLPVVPPVPFTAEQAGRLAALAAVALVANFSGALLSQNGDAVTSAFDRSDEALGVALAVARAGVLVSLVAIALADRWGRRKLILLGLLGACAANLLTALSPTYEVFTGAQLLNRALVNTVLIVAGIAAVEDAPEGARAFATGMYALALGAGFGLAVVLLPLADLGDYGWRISFALSAGLVLLIPLIAPHLKETKRYVRVADRTEARGRVRELFDRAYGARFLLLGLAAFLTNVFSAPSSQLTNRYLTHEHDYTNADVALFRVVTAGLPGLIGVLLASRLAESRGRRPVTIVGLLVATVFQAAFFLAGSDVLLWLAPVVAIVAAACAGLALGTLDAELFPTEVRGTSSGFLLVSGVAGSAVGLVLATQLKDVAGGLGPAIALCGIAALVAALFVVPRLPETADRALDEVSPSEV
jgi:AAHS family 4-hydroxybenzoate transporter-like MFS transporter